MRLPVVERRPETTASRCIITVSLWYVYCYSVYMKRSTRREGKREKRKKKREGEREDGERERSYVWQNSVGRRMNTTNH